MRHLGAMGYLMETDEDEYKTTNYCKSMSLSTIGDGYLAMCVPPFEDVLLAKMNRILMFIRLSCTSAGAMRFHEFSRKRGWDNPVNSKDTSMMYAYGTDKDMFAWQQHLGYGRHFNHHMDGCRHGLLPWTAPEFFPVKERLFDGADTDPEAPFLVDIAGGIGYRLAQFQRSSTTIPGKLILQDLPDVVIQAKVLFPDIVCMEHNFYEEQPVKGKISIQELYYPLSANW